MDPTTNINKDVFAHQVDSNYICSQNNPQELFGLVQVVQEMIVCLDQYLKEALLT